MQVKIFSINNSLIKWPSRRGASGRIRTSDTSLFRALLYSWATEAFYILYVTRPRWRSYGLIATFTRSPVKIRIRFFLNLPLITALISWPLSKSILKFAWGSNSITFPSYSKTSSFGNLIFSLFVLRLIQHALLNLRSLREL